VIEIEGQDDMTDIPATPGGQSQPGSGQQPGGAAPAGNSQPLDQLDRQAQHQQQRPPENPNTRGHSPARDVREAAAARPPGQQQDQQDGQQQQQPGGGDEIQIGDVKISPDKFKEIMARQAEIDTRDRSLPQSADAYELKVPENFKPPGDVKFEFNKDDPVLAQARQLAHARKMDQATFSDFLSVYAADRIRQATIVNTARNAEIGKLGTMAPQRIDAVKTWAHGTLGSDLGGAIEQMLVTAKHVEAFEKIINRFAQQGGVQFSQQHRESEPPRGTIPGYANMSFEQKRAAQMQMNPPKQTFRER
jgi:hypothetical protein